MHKIKNWFLGLNLGLRITVIVAGVAIITGAIVAPILIFSNTQEEVASSDKSQVADKNTTPSNNSEKDKNSEDKDKTDSDKSEEDPTNTEQSQTTANNNSNPQTTPNNTNNQQNNTGSSTANPTNPSSPSQPSKPNTPTQPTTPTQPETPAKTEAELIAERDQQRRNDMVRVRSAVMSYQANNNGKLPKAGGPILQPSKSYFTIEQTYNQQLCSNDSATCLVAYYLNDYKTTTKNSFIDPSGWSYGLTILHYDDYLSYGEKGLSYMIYMIHQAQCGTATSVLRTDYQRDYAILYKLENGNTYCINNEQR